MNHSTHVFPALPTQLTGQTLVCHAGLSVLTSFLNALDFRQLCEDRFSQFMPATATHRPGKILGALALSLPDDLYDEHGTCVERRFWSAPTATGFILFLMLSDRLHGDYRYLLETKLTDILTACTGQVQEADLIFFLE